MHPSGPSFAAPGPPGAPCPHCGDRRVLTLPDGALLCGGCRQPLRGPSGTLRAVLPSSSGELAAARRRLSSGERVAAHPGVVSALPRPVESGAVSAVGPGMGGAGASTPDGGRRDAAPPRISRYSVVRECGRGGMGIVYEAHDPDLDRRVAIKLLMPNALAGHDGGEELERFLQEARLTARLRHPGIVAIHEVGRDGARPFIVMDFIEGEPLSVVLARGRPAPRRSAEIVRDVAIALAHAHDNGVIHRDVKPQNVLMDADDRPRLTDFGLARDDETRRRLTLSGEALGTPDFMAPEQAKADAKSQSAATDVWAAGALLYRALTGKSPFAAPTAMAVLHRVVSDDPDPPELINEAVPRDLSTIVMKCLEKEPERRYPTAGDLAGDLDRFLEGSPIDARPPGALSRVVRRVRRSPGGAAAVVLGAALLVSVPASIALRERAVAEAARAARAELVDAARADARAAVAAFDAARGQLDDAAPDLDTPEDDLAEGRREGTDRVLALGLKAFRATSRLHGLTPDDDDARELLRSAARGLGEVALAGRQWSLAASAFEEAATVSDADAAETRADLERVRTARSARREAALAAVEEVIVAARGGELADADRFEDALFVLVRHRRRETVARLARELDEISAALRAATVEALRPMATPSAAERAVGKRSLDGLDAALAASVAAPPPPGPRLSAAHRDLIEEARGRIYSRARLAGRVTDDQPKATAARLLAGEQEARVDAASLLTARLCCEALGRIGVRDGAVAALARYVLSDWSQARAAVGGVAAVRLRAPPETIDPLLERAIDRFGIGGEFYHALARAGVEPSTDGAAEDWRALLRAAAAEKSRRAYDVAITLIDRAIAVAPNEPQIWSARGVTLTEAGRQAEAITAFDRAIELEPVDPMSWSVRGRAKVRAGRTVDGLVDHARALEIAPRRAVVWFHRARDLWLLRRADEALADLERCLALDPSFANGRLLRGTIRRAKGDLAGAIADYDFVLERDPNDSAAWQNRALARARGGELEGARADIEQALSLGPRDEAMLRIRAEIRWGQGDRRGALEDLDRALELAPESHDALASRALYRRDAGDAAGAVRDFVSICQRSPRSATYRMELAAARIEAGDLRGAERDFAASVELAPDSPSPRIGAAITIALAGDRRRAREQLAALVRATRMPGRAPLWLAVLGGDTGPLAGVIARDQQDFDARVARHLLGRIDAPTLLDTAGRVGGTDDLRRAARIIAHTFIGAQLEVAGDADGARDHYRAAVELEWVRGIGFVRAWSAHRLRELGRGR